MNLLKMLIRVAALLGVASIAYGAEFYQWSNSTGSTGPFYDSKEAAIAAWRAGHPARVNLTKDLGITAATLQRGSEQVWRPFPLIPYSAHGAYMNIVTGATYTTESALLAALQAAWQNDPPLRRAWFLQSQHATGRPNIRPCRPMEALATCAITRCRTLPGVGRRPRVVRAADIVFQRRAPKGRHLPPVLRALRDGAVLPGQHHCIRFRSVEILRLRSESCKHQGRQSDQRIVRREDSVRDRLLGGGAEARSDVPILGCQFLRKLAVGLDAQLRCSNNHCRRRTSRRHPT